MKIFYYIILRSDRLKISRGLFKYPCLLTEFEAYNTLRSFNDFNGDVVRELRINRRL